MRDKQRKGKLRSNYYSATLGLMEEHVLDTNAGKQLP